MGQGALSKPVVQWWLSLNSSISNATWSEARFSGSLQRTKHPTRRALYARRSARMTANLAAAESFRSICRPLRFQLGRDGPIIDLGSPWRFGSRAHHAAVLYREPATRHRFLVVLGP